MTEAGIDPAAAFSQMADDAVEEGELDGEKKPDL
jgi:hypothetical protein